MRNIICIIQARTGSTRLNGKVLREIKNKTILERVIDRVKNSRYINKIVIATTDKEEDNIIESLVRKINENLFRGSEEDVLKRYYDAATKFNADVIVRITSDCPLIDYEIIDGIIEKFIDEKVDYCSNTIERTFPRGLDVEVFSYQVLKLATENAVLQEDREHVTPYIWKRKQVFNISQYKQEKDLSHIRITVDTKEDFEVIKLIYENFIDEKYFGLKEIEGFLNHNKDILDINKEIEQKKIEERFFLRDVNYSDKELLLNWRNEIDVRIASFTSEKITVKQHNIWFENLMKSKENKIYIFFKDDIPIGNVFLIKNNLDFNLSYSIDSKYRGLGYAKKMLNMLEENVKGVKILAKVKTDNLKSINVLKKLNYKQKLEHKIVIFSKVIEE